MMPVMMPVIGDVTIDLCQQNRAYMFAYAGDLAGMTPMRRLVGHTE